MQHFYYRLTFLSAYATVLVGMPALSCIQFVFSNPEFPISSDNTPLLYVVPWNKIKIEIKIIHHTTEKYQNITFIITMQAIYFKSGHDSRVVHRVWSEGSWDLVVKALWHIKTSRASITWLWLPSEVFLTIL